MAKSKLPKDANQRAVMIAQIATGEIEAPKPDEGNSKTLSSFTPTTELQLNKNPILEGEIKLFGKVIDSGGDNPNVHLKINDDKILIFQTTEAFAKELAHRLYAMKNLKS